MWRSWVPVLGLSMAASMVAAQSEPDPAYDGRFDFARLSYPGTGCTTNEGPGWQHDYPMGERNLMRTVKDLTSLSPWTEGSGVFSPADPKLMHHPIAYLSEPGCWVPAEAEVKGLRAYLSKGGFLIIDDFSGSTHWTNFVTQMRRVLPEARIMPVSRSDPVFKVFFNLTDVKLEGKILGIYEDNNPKKRLLVVVNYNTAIANQWQWSASSRSPVDTTNKAYKLGVNYIIYGLTH